MKYIKLKKVYDSIIEKQSSKKNVEIWGSGKPKREIMYVDDISSAIFFIIKKKLSKDKFLMNYLKKSSVINVGSDKEYTIKQIAKIIAKVTSDKKTQIGVAVAIFIIIILII